MQLFSVALSVRRPAGIGLLVERGFEEACDGMWILTLDMRAVIDPSLKLMEKAARRVVQWRLGGLLGSLPSSDSGGSFGGSWRLTFPGAGSARLIVPS